jgi:hypothetical protein
LTAKNIVFLTTVEEPLVDLEILKNGIKFLTLKVNENKNLNDLRKQAGFSD